MPAHRKPTALLQSSGSFEHNRGRYAGRVAEPTPTGPLGPPPKHFDKAHAALWRELAQAAPPGVLTSSDRWMVELTCTLMHGQRAGMASAAAPKPDTEDPWSQFANVH